jgi:hypothetical protein
MSDTTSSFDARDRDPDEPLGGGAGAETDDGIAAGQRGSGERPGPGTAVDDDRSGSAVQMQTRNGTTSETTGTGTGPADEPLGDAHVQLTRLIDQLRTDVMRTDDPRLQALLETSAEVLLGLAKAFTEHARRNEPAWEDRPADRGNAR